MKGHFQLSGSYEGKRTRDWLKIKTENNEEFVVTGYTRGAGRRAGALDAGHHVEHLAGLGDLVHPVDPGAVPGADRRGGGSAHRRDRRLPAHPAAADLLPRWRVEAAAHDVKNAKAQFYPNINLVAFAGLSSIGLGNLLNAGSLQYGAGPAIHLPIFEGGKLRAASWTEAFGPAGSGFFSYWSLTRPS